MRILVLLIVSGCFHAGNLAPVLPGPTFGGIPISAWDGPRCVRDVECVSASEALALEQRRRAHDKPTLARARELTRAAVAAARAHDCAMVERLRRDMLALPTVDLEGGAHDAIFLREPLVELI